MIGLVYPSSSIGHYPHSGYLENYTACRVVVIGHDLHAEPPAQGCGRGPREQLVDQWNRGLRAIRDAEIELAIVTDSAFAPTPGWLDPLVDAIREDCGEFFGPVTNRPGNAKQQWAGRWIDDHRDTDRNEDVIATAESLHGITLPPQPTPLLGSFCMVGLTEDWFRYAAHADNVFDPNAPAGQAEVDYFMRAKSMGAKLAIVPQSFVFVMESTYRKAHPQGNGR